MNTCIRRICKMAVLVLAGFTFGVQAENAPAPKEITKETTTDTPIEATIDTTTENIDGSAAPQTQASSEETTQDRIFRPSEDISEDLVIAFPVDI